MSHASSSFEPSAEVVLCSAKGKNHNFVGERDELTMVSGDSAHGEDGSRHHQYVPSPASESQPHELPTVDSAASSHLQNTEMNNSALYQNQQLSQVQASTSPLRSALLEDSRASSVEVIDSGRYSSSREGANILHKPMIMQSLPPPPAANHTVNSVKDSFEAMHTIISCTGISNRLILAYTGLQLCWTVDSTIFLQDTRSSGNTYVPFPDASYASAAADAVGSNERLIRDRDFKQHVLCSTNATADATTVTISATAATAAHVLWVILRCIVNDAKCHGGLWVWRARHAAVAFFDTAQFSLDAATAFDAAAEATHQS